MSKFTDYLLFKTPFNKIENRMGEDQPEKVSGSRIAISLIGLLLGIFLSFFFTGFSKQSAVPSSNKTTTEQTSSPGNVVNVNKTAEPDIVFISWNKLWKYALISFVICGLTFQGLYQNLKLYLKEPVLLTLFVAFQYGFFWQSVVNGGASLM